MRILLVPPSCGNEAIKTDSMAAMDAMDAMDSMDSQKAVASAREDDLTAVGLLELLDVDDRPVLVLDLASPTKNVPVYHNASLQKMPLLESKIMDGVLAAGVSARDPDYAAFLDWAAASPEDGFPHTTYCGFWWTAKTIRSRWRIVTGAEGDEYGYTCTRQHLSGSPKHARAKTAGLQRPSHSPSQSRSKVTSNESLEAQIAAFRLREGTPTHSFPTPDSDGTPRTIQPSTNLERLDFIKAYPNSVPDPHIQFFMEFDWASTGLGPIESWSTALRRMANILLSDPRPAAMYWGRERTMMYNEAYVRVTGQKHPGSTFVNLLS